MEGVLAGEKRTYDCPILLRLYGPADPVVRANCMLSWDPPHITRVSKIKSHLANYDTQWKVSWRPRDYH